MKLIRLLALSLGLLTSSATFAEQFSVLLFSKTDGWHHDSINAGVTAVQALGKLHDFNVFWTEDANRVFNDKELPKYKAVIFLLTTGDVLNAEQQAAFERYMRAGGGFVGVHSASDTEYDWEWYTKMVGYMFHIHPAVQSAAVKVENYNFPGMDRFAKRFLFTEEWYEFGAPKSDKLKFLLCDEGRRNGRVSSGELVSGIRWRPGVLHGPRPFARRLQRRQFPPSHLRRNLLGRDRQRFFGGVVRIT